MIPERFLTPDPQPPDEFAYPDSKPEQDKPRAEVAFDFLFNDRDPRIRKYLETCKGLMGHLLTEPVIELFQQKRVDVPGLRHMRVWEVGLTLWNRHGFRNRRDEIRYLLNFFQWKFCPGADSFKEVRLRKIEERAKQVAIDLKDSEEFMERGDEHRTAKAMRRLDLDTKPPAWIVATAKGTRHRLTAAELEKIILCLSRFRKEVTTSARILEDLTLLNHNKTQLALNHLRESGLLEKIKGHSVGKYRRSYAARFRLHF